MIEPKRKSASKVPKDFNELVELYDYFITVHIYKISKQSVREDDVADLKQMVYTRLWEQRCLDKYDPAKGAFSTYLFWVIRSVVVNQFDMNSRNPLNQAKGTRVSRYRATEGDKWESSRVPLDVLPQFQDRDFEQREMVADVVARLEVTAATTKQGAELLDVMRLLYDGHTPNEVARRTGRSQTKVTGYRKRLQGMLRGRLQVGA